jgi:type IV pilus assembly protein PilO
MNMEDFNNLDPKNIGNWPIPVKALIILVLCAAALFAGYWFDTQTQLAELDKVKAKEGELKKEFKKKQLEAATLDKLKEQLAQIQTILKELLQKLPDDAKVSELIREISQTVLANGLKQELFKPQYGREESKEGLYVALPIQLRASGNYHAFGKFVSDVAAMNRIVTQHNVAIKAKKSESKHPLTLEMMAKVYYQKQDEEDKKSKTKKSKK